MNCFVIFDTLINTLNLIYFVYWVVRESVRKALANKKLEFVDLKELAESSKKIGMIKFGFDTSKILKKSKILENMKTQTNLGKWF